jgi:hypothetical protein
MNSNLKYSFKGFMLAVLFIAAVKFFSFAYTLYFPNKIPHRDTIVKASVPYFFMVNERGKKLFHDNCSVCHSLWSTDNPPWLENIEQRVLDCDVLYSFIKNSDEVIKSGDPYFVQLYNDYGKISMNKFPNLTDNDIDDILEYINQFYENRNHRTSSDAH